MYTAQGEKGNKLNIYPVYTLYSTLSKMTEISYFIYHHFINGEIVPKVMKLVRMRLNFVLLN